MAAPSRHPQEADNPNTVPVAVLAVESAPSPVAGNASRIQVLGPPASGGGPGPDFLLRIVRSSLAYRPAPDQDVITIGRQRTKPGCPEGNDFVVRVEGDGDSSLRISRFHLRILRRHGGCYIEDVSSGGTLLNDEALPRGTAIPIGRGDRLSLAGVLFLDVVFGPLAVERAPATTALPEGTIVFEACRGDLVSLP